MKNKQFDCIKMKRESAEKIYQKIKMMSIEEELCFWNSDLCVESENQPASLVYELYALTEEEIKIVEGK